jgi:hypothetical protein
MSKNLYQRLIEVMRTMGAIAKNGQATYGDKYAYHRIDDIDDKLRDALIEHGVVAMVTSIEDRQMGHWQDPPDRYDKVKTTWHCECLITIEFVNADNPEDRTKIVGWGQGLDNSDKATGKAISYALKSAYLSAFHLRGQPDNEADNITKPSPVAERPPVAKQAPEPVVTEAMQSWLAAMDQCDDVESFDMLDRSIQAEPKELRDSIEGYRQQAEIRCFRAEINKSKSIEDLNLVAVKIAARPEYVRLPMRTAYGTKMASLKNATKGA